MSEFRRKIIRQAPPVVMDHIPKIEQEPELPIEGLPEATQAPAESKIERPRLKRMSNEERMEAGEKIWNKLLTGDFEPLGREDMASLFSSIGWGTQVVNQIINERRNGISFVKDDQSGTYLFDAKQTYEYLKDKVKPKDNGNQCTIPALPKADIDFYATLARKYNTTINVVFRRVLMKNAQEERERIDDRLQKHIEEMKRKLIEEVSIDA